MASVARHLAGPPCAKVRHLLVNKIRKKNLINIPDQPQNLMGSKLEQNPHLIFPLRSNL